MQKLTLKLSRPHNDNMNKNLNKKMKKKKKKKTQLIGKIYSEACYAILCMRYFLSTPLYFVIQISITTHQFIVLELVPIWVHIYATK